MGDNSAEERSAAAVDGGAIRRWLTSAYADLTDGQRWTMVLLVVLIGAFMSFGLREPSRLEAQRATQVTGPVNQAVSTGGADVAGAAGLALGDEASALPDTIQPATFSSPTFSSEPVAVEGPASGGFESAEAPVAPAAPVKPAVSVAAVVRDTGQAPGAEDAAMAAVFLPDVGVPVKVVALGAAEGELCTSTGAVMVVVASEGLPATLRSCLEGVGTAVLSHDQAGTTVRSISTRLGAAPAMVAAAGQVKTDRKLGLAVATAVEAEAKVAKTSLEGLGYEVIAAVVPEGDAVAMTSGIRAFASAGVEAAVFALPAADLRRWVALEGPLGFRPAHLVADVADAITNEASAPALEGASAVAATKVRWHIRKNGESASQKACRERYAATSPLAEVAAGSSLVRVLAWCQHAVILREALGAGGDVGEAIRARSFESPLTSRLQARGGGDFGPSQLAVLTWKGDCNCWTESTPFRDRTSS